MLTLFTGRQSRNCEGMTRRSFVSAGTLGLGGLTLPSLLAARGQAARKPDSGVLAGKSVVVLFLHGGSTHVETFDPKMTAPAEYRSMTGEVKTNIPGVTFGGDFTNLAKVADKMAVVRSFRHGSSSHGRAQQMVLSGGNAMKASMGSVYARVAGTSNSHSGLPNYSIIPAGAVDAKKFKRGNPLKTPTSPGDLGSAYAPFDPSAGGEVIDNMKLSMTSDRLDDRRTLLTQLDRIKRNVAASSSLAGADRFQQQAFDVILGGAANAFDISKEDRKTLDLYDTKQYSDKRDAAALGHQMLMARRLCEAGSGFVTVSSAGWDMHRGLVKEMKTRGRAVDVAVSAFIRDLEQRGLSDKILLVITGEFGRTPRINKNAGRDHWGNLCTLAFAGGGLKMGQVIGSSNRNVSVPATHKVGVQDLMGTVMHTLVDPGVVRLRPTIPSDVTRMLDAGSPIPQLV
jgi:uncharacterized protein (DUF1501 family)